MVMVPKPPGSRQLISPAVAVLEIAPAKVLQGAVRLQGLTSSPTPETQVRVAWAWAGTEASNGAKNPAAMASKAMRRMIYLLVFAEVPSAVLNHDAIVLEPETPLAAILRQMNALKRFSPNAIPFLRL